MQCLNFFVFQNHFDYIVNFRAVSVHFYKKSYFIRHYYTCYIISVLYIKYSIPYLLYSNRYYKNIIYYNCIIKSSNL